MNQQTPVHLARAVLFCLVFSLLAVPAPASVYTADGTDISSEDLTGIIREDPTLTTGILGPGKIVFFTNSHCGACQGAKTYLDTFTQDHPDVLLGTYDLFGSTENRAIFEQYKEDYHQPFLATPSVMIGNLTLEGVHDIQTHLKTIVAIQEEMMNSGSDMLPVTQEASSENHPA